MTFPSKLVTAAAPLTVDEVEDTKMEIKFRPEDGVSSYELYAKSPKTGEQRFACIREYGLCELTHLRPGVNYTIGLVYCFGAHPVQCLLKARRTFARTRPPSRFILLYAHVN